MKSFKAINEKKKAIIIGGQYGAGGWNTGNGFNYSTANYVCLYCPNDNGDG